MSQQLRDDLTRGVAGSSAMTLLDGYLSREELAVQLNVKIRTLQLWERLGSGPPITRLGKTPYYKRASVADWIERQEKRQPREAAHRRRRRATIEQAIA